MPGDINPTSIFWWQILSLEKSLVHHDQKNRDIQLWKISQKACSNFRGKRRTVIWSLVSHQRRDNILGFWYGHCHSLALVSPHPKAFLPPDAIERVNKELCKKLTLPQVVKKNQQHWVNKVNCQMLFYFVMKSISPNVHIQISHSRLYIAVPGHWKKKWLLLPILLPWKQPKRGFHLCFKSSVGCKCYKFPNAIMS